MIVLNLELLVSTKWAKFVCFFIAHCCYSECSDSKSIPWTLKPKRRFTV